MNVNQFCKQDQCVCSIVKTIAQRQLGIDEENTCDVEQELGNQIRLDTVPLLLVCSSGCEYFIASGIFRDPGTTNFKCIQTPVFRVLNVNEKTCCADLELLQPQTATGTVPPITQQDGVCRFFPTNLIQKFIRTGIFVTVDLNCYCGVECLPAVFAPKGTPQLPQNICLNPIITVNAPDTINCSGIVTGNVSCNGLPIQNAVVILESTPNVINFNPNPVVTDVNGNYQVIADVATNTPSTPVIITATTTVNGVSATATDATTVQCTTASGCNNCGINIGTNAADQEVTVISPTGTTLYTGNITLNALSCGQSCNPSNNTFSVSFTGTNGSSGTTINFVQGRRTTATCTVPTAASITGPARVTGNNPFPNNDIFTVTISVTNINMNTGTWTITATDNSGNSFTTTFTGPVNPNVIQTCP